MNAGISECSTGWSEKQANQSVLFRMFPLKLLALSAVLAAILVSLMPDGEHAMASATGNVRADGTEIVLPVSAPVPARAV
jgi:hypothetical protein